jgi:hypothetical protein
MHKHYIPIIAPSWRQKLNPGDHEIKNKYVEVFLFHSNRHLLLILYVQF